MSSIPETVSTADRDRIKEIMQAHGYEELTETQAQAFREGVLENDNTLLVAETGNGKTMVAESIVKKTLDNNGSVAYLVPSYQLTQAKKEELEEWIKDDYDVQTGLGGIGDGGIPVLTFESFFQAVMRDIRGIRSVDQVVFDDFHEIYSYHRGPGIEKAITACLDQEIDIFAMSATLGNPNELADWLNADLIESDYDRSIPVVETPIENDSGMTKGEQIARIIDERSDRSPFLVFNNRRDWAETRAEDIADTELFSDTNDRDFEAEIDNKLSTEMTSKYETLADLMENGVAFHHSGLDSAVRDLIVDAVQNGDLMCVSATPGLAYGFDAPIQSVIVADLKRYGDYIGVYEYVQWIGRAGRPGYGYDEGYAFPIINDERADDVFQFSLPAKHKELEPVETHIEADPEFRQLVLELIDFDWNTPEKLEEFVKQSLYWEQFQSMGAWGEYHGTAEVQIEEQLQQTVKWLDRRGLVEQRRTRTEFDTTRTGEAAIEFMYETWIDTPLENITSLYRELGRVKDSPLELVMELARQFDRVTLRELPDDSTFDSRLLDAGLPTTDEARTAGMLCWHWCGGDRLDEIEAKYNIDPTTIPGTARSVSDLLSATGHLFEADTDLSQPDWYHTFQSQMRHGVSSEDIYLAEQVDHLGRGRIASIKKYVAQLPATNNSDSLPEQLHSILEESDRRQLQDVLKSVGGIGDSISNDLADTVEEWDGSMSGMAVPPLESTGDASEQTGKENENTNGFTQASSLDDFTE